MYRYGTRISFPFSNILAAQGKLIGYDFNNVGHNYISGVRVLLAISSTDSLYDRLHLALDREILGNNYRDWTFSGPKLSPIQHFVDHTPESESEDEDDIMSLHNSGKVGNDELLVYWRP